MRGTERAQGGKRRAQLALDRIRGERPRRSGHADRVERLLELIAADEVRHAQSAADLIAKRIEADAAVVPRVLDAAVSFRHYGETAAAPEPRPPPAPPHDAQPLARRALALHRSLGLPARAARSHHRLLATERPLRTHQPVKPLA